MHFSAVYIEADFSRHQTANPLEQRWCFYSAAAFIDNTLNLWHINVLLQADLK